MAEAINIQLLNQGFGAYLTNILPEDQATACGAFAFSMSQIPNITNLDIESFAQMVFSMETNVNLPLTNGTDVPANVDSLITASQKVALGSGPYGTYTMSDFFGCATSLPYPWKQFTVGIGNLQTPALQTTYQNLFLAVDWAPASIGVTYTTPTNVPTGLFIISPGGGYGRNGAPAPSITLSNGGTGTCTIGTDPNNLSTFGKVTSVTLTVPGPPSLSVPTASIPLPPDNGTGGYPGMNTVVAALISQANTDIANIYNDPNKTELVNLVNLVYTKLGNQLMIEQRARYFALSPVNVPRDNSYAPYPASLISFVDGLSTTALNTLPHMQVQSLEALSDYCSQGGQTLVGVMRQVRNNARLTETGIQNEVDVPSQLDENYSQQLILNGTVPLATEGTGIGKFTIPSWPENATCAGDPLVPNPVNYYDSTIDGIVIPEGQAQSGSLDNLQILVNSESLLGNTTTTILANTNPRLGVVAVNSVVKSGPYINPRNLLPNDTGEAQTSLLVPAGSLIAELQMQKGAVNNARQFLPINLDAKYISGIVLQSQLSIQESIDQVIECNCDCWVT